MKIDNISFHDGEFIYHMSQHVLLQIYSIDFKNPSDIVNYIREICKEFDVQAFMFVCSRHIYVTKNHFVVTYVGKF